MTSAEVRALIDHAAACAMAATAEVRALIDHAAACAMAATQRELRAEARRIPAGRKGAARRQRLARLRAEYAGLPSDRNRRRGVSQ